MLGTTGSGLNWSWRIAIRQHFTAGVSLTFVIALQWALVATYYNVLPHNLVVKARHFLLLNLLVAVLMVLLAKTLQNSPARLLCWIPNSSQWLGNPVREVQCRKFLFQSFLWVACFVQVFLFCDTWLVLDAWAMHADHSKTSPVSSFWKNCLRFVCSLKLTDILVVFRYAFGWIIHRLSLYLVPKV
jgi:hypothetical protein